MAEATLLGGRYELGEVLGRGGMAEVRAGRDLRLGRAVAVKMLRVDLARDPTFQNRFRREAQAAASLNHPAIVAVYDTGEDDGVPYIVMEYVVGRTVRQMLITEGKPPLREALRIAAVVCDALDYSHRQGIVHRDIKPGNVMLTRTGAVKVMDFGIARAVAASTATVTQTAAVIGTAQYLSPEQARGEHVDARSDIYSVGCLLYELLTGTPPFTGESAVAVAYQHVRETPVPPSQVDPAVPVDAEAVVLTALAKDPAHRYQTAAELKADIDRVLSGRPVLAAVPAGAATAVLPAMGPEAPTVLVPPPEPPVPPRRRHTAGWLLLALACVAVAVAAALIARQLAGSATDTVPSLHGKNLAQATAALRAAGLELGAHPGVPSAQPVGTVVTQDPTAGSTVAAGSAVAVTVSTGVRQVPVPELRGQTLDAAKTLLAGDGLKAAVVAHRNSNRPVNTVLFQSPAPGTTVAAGRTVDLTVASGSNVVPPVRGDQAAVAAAALRAAGFQVFEVPEFTTAVPAGTVVNQSPGAHTTQPVGSTVTIHVATAPSISPSPVTPTPTPTTPSATPTSSPPPTPTPT